MGLFVVMILEAMARWAEAHSPVGRAEWRVVADVPLPGPAARFDYQSLDSTTGWLWIAHMGAGELLAFDTRTRRVVARVPDLPRVTGVLAVPALQRVFAAVGGGHEVAVLDARSGRLLSRIRGGSFPDGLAYAAAARKLFVSDESGRQELVIDEPAGASRRPVALGGEAGNTQYDPTSNRIWVAVQTRNELAAIDPVKDSVVARVPIPGIEHPQGVLIDAAHRIAYVAGEANGRVGVLDLRTLRVVGTYPVGDGPDVLAMDPARHRLFVASESGVIAAFDALRDSLIPLPRYEAPRAHSVAVDPRTHLVYVPLENLSGRPALRILMLQPR
jgi:DNA-binding beta-propeller fold protein YncE